MASSGKQHTTSTSPLAQAPPHPQPHTYSFRSLLATGWFRLTLGILTTAMAGLIVSQSNPGESPWLPPCIFHQLTGLHCPGCGNTRALHALTHGQILQSLDYNLLLVPGILTLWTLLLKPNLANHYGFALAILIIVLLFFVLRNIPCYPFTILAP